MRGPLLAKRPVDGRQITLAAHATTVSAAAGLLFGRAEEPTRLGREWARFFRLPPAQFPAFLLNLQVAAFLHDLGKATDTFQAALHRRGEQVIRHEHLSALLLCLEPVQQWLKGHESSGVDAEVIRAAVVAHHLKANHEDLAKPLVEGHPGFTVFTTAPDFLECLCLAAPWVQTPPPDLSPYDRPWSFDADVEPIAEAFKRAAYRFKAAIRHDAARRRLLVAVKAALMAADSVGSAMVREGQSLPGWISACFDPAPLTPAWVEAKIIRPRILDIERRSGRAFEWHEFQLAMAGQGDRVVLLSGCGTGKTLAAWNWIQTQLQHRPASRVLFLYPTRGTATEGFRDYVSWAGGEDAALLHGTAAYDLQGMFENPGDPRRGGQYDVQARLFALGYWPKRVFSATVDSFLAFMRNQYGSLCLLPVLADSIVVVDEVHSFDQAMFTALEAFLRFFDIPVLCMTASLPADRLRTLREACGLAVFPEDPAAFADLRAQSEAPRYRLAPIQEGQALALARDAVTAGKRVLWVTNTVRRCQRNARALRARLPGAIALLCYHSRFRLSDRRTRHTEVLRRFRKGCAPVVGVTTQVCEMSLDIDADVLITEIAPVPSLIQRMGRCCRQPLPLDGRVGEVYVYRVSGPRPYQGRDVEAGEAFAEVMGARQRLLSHADLANYLAEMPVSDPFPEGGYTGFLDGGPYAMAQEESFREGGDFTCDCVLDSDVEAFLQCRRGGDPATDGFVVPVPRRFARANPRLGRYLCEAPGAHYDARLGFLGEEVGPDR